MTQDSESLRLEMLDEASLTRQPDEVFDIISKLGEGSYGSVFKAIHKESKQVLAIKQVPVDTDLQDIIKEISIMQQCVSPYVVRYGMLFLVISALDIALCSVQVLRQLL